MIHVERRGPADGSPVLLLHGVGLDHRMWARCLPALREHHVLLPDLRGHGQSPPARSGTSLSDLTDDVAVHLDRPTHLVGFSLGALVAQRLAATDPTHVRSLTLISSVADRSPAERAAVRQRLQRAATDFPASVEAAVQRWFSPDWQRQDPELAEQVRDRLASTDVQSYLHCYRAFAEADLEVAPLLRSISAPTLVVTGEHDGGSTPAMAHRLGAAIPTTRSVVVVPGARHLLPLQRPDEVTNPLLALISEVEHHEHCYHV
jgi:(E)-2-((N-methylformamido)methylene)succinate hydrolase